MTTVRNFRAWVDHRTRTLGAVLRGYYQAERAGFYGEAWVWGPLIERVPELEADLAILLAGSDEARLELFKEEKNIDVGYRYPDCA